jgi:hypothetical protein
LIVETTAETESPTVKIRLKNEPVFDKSLNTILLALLTERYRYVGEKTTGRAILASAPFAVLTIDC